MLDHRTLVNQRICDQLLDRNGFRNQTALVSAILSAQLSSGDGFITYDDIPSSNQVVNDDQFRFNREPDWDSSLPNGIIIYRIKTMEEDEDEVELELTEEEAQVAEARYRDEQELTEEDEVEDIDIVKNELDFRGVKYTNVIEMDEDPKYEEESIEIYEWYVVSDYFASKLKEFGEIVIETDLETWWGRQATGQSVTMDSVIGEIAEDMEILEGQASSWAPKEE